MLLHSLAILAIISSASAHSWVEQMRVIAPNGTFTGLPGYARGNFLRTATGFNDTTMTYLIPPDGQANVTVVYNTTKLCKDTQQTQTQTLHSPRLRVNAGDAVALRYQENGHVTLPWNQPGKPPNRGTVYVYGTSKPKVGETLLDVHGVWNWNGTGGDGRGMLLSEQNFDDGRCYQINTGNISEYRQGKYAHEANQLMGADLWCQQDIKIPASTPTGKMYTLYWVWDWPTRPDADPTYPDGKQEIYTTCMDIDVVGQASNSSSDATETDSYDEGQSLDEAAIPDEFDDLTNEHAVNLSGSASIAAATSSTQTESSTASSTPIEPTTTMSSAQSTVTVTVAASTVTIPASTVTIPASTVTALRTVVKAEVEVMERTVTVTANGCQST